MMPVETIRLILDSLIPMSLLWMEIWSIEMGFNFIQIPFKMVFTNVAFFNGNRFIRDQVKIRREYALNGAKGSILCL